jgi:DNA-binding beta-propeller fold protein YncE
MKNYSRKHAFLRIAASFMIMGLFANWQVNESAAAQGLGNDILYTTDADFDQGTLVSVNHEAPGNDQLQLDSSARIFSFINITAGGGYVVRANTETGEILGQYHTRPQGHSPSPYNTAVDQFGNVWIANGGDSSPLGGVPHGSVVKIGLIVGGTRVDENGFPDSNGGYLAPPYRYNTCVDRNGDGLLRTSKGLDDMLDWPDLTDGLGGADGLVQDAVDECILIYQRLPNAENAHHVSVDADNNVWAAGYPQALRMFYKLDGSNGAILDSFDARSIGCGGLGGLIDGNGILWSVGGSLLRYDPTTHSGNCIQRYGHGFPVGKQYVHGLGMDTNGYIWMSIIDGGIVKIALDGTVAPGFPKPTYPPSLMTSSPLTPLSESGSQPYDSDSSPSIHAAPYHNWVASWDPWTPGSTISLTIEDSGGVLYSGSQIADDSGNFNFDLWSFDLVPAQQVTASDGITTKTHTVINLGIMDINTDTDQIHGTADPGAALWVWADLFSSGSGRSVVADASGNWLADFSVPGNGQPIYDLTSVTHVGVNVFDEDGDSTYGKNSPFPEENYGVAVTPADNNVWVANSDPATVTRFDNDGNFIKRIITGADPRGVAVDAAGKVWVINLSSDNAVRIDPNGGSDGLGAVDMSVQLEGGAGPYSYSNMTGAVMVGSVSPQGAWSMVQDSRRRGFQWGRITWNTESAGSEPPGTAIVVEARAANTEAGLGGETFLPALNGDLFSMTGRFIEVRATLKASQEGVSPVLSDLRIQPTMISVDIDIKPGSSFNSINCKNKQAVIPVAILTTADFNALTVNHKTVTFEGAHEIHMNWWAHQPIRHVKDVDYDGDLDLVFHFRLRDTALTCESTTGPLQGLTYNGIPIAGTDSVRMIKHGKLR